MFYYISFVDDFSQYTWIFPVKFKSDTIIIFKQFKQQVENLLDRKIKEVRCDEGGEFKPFENGIIVQLACPYTSPKMGVLKGNTGTLWRQNYLFLLRSKCR